MIVYVAGPYSSNPERGVANAMEVGNKLIELGHVPLMPLLNHFWDLRHPKDYETWMQQDFVLLSLADAIYYLPGTSSGRDRELVFAERHGILILDELPARAEPATWDTMWRPGRPVNDPALAPRPRLGS